MAWFEIAVSFNIAEEIFVFIYLKAKIVLANLGYQLSWLLTSGLHPNLSIIQTIVTLFGLCSDQGPNHYKNLVHYPKSFEIENLENLQRS